MFTNPVEVIERLCWQHNGDESKEVSQTYVRAKKLFRGILDHQLLRDTEIHYKLGIKASDDNVAHATYQVKQQRRIEEEDLTAAKRAINGEWCFLCDHKCKGPKDLASHMMHLHPKWDRGSTEQAGMSLQSSAAYLSSLEKIRIAKEVEAGAADFKLIPAKKHKRCLDEYLCLHCNTPLSTTIDGIERHVEAHKADDFMVTALASESDPDKPGFGLYQDSEHVWINKEGHFWFCKIRFKAHSIKPPVRCRVENDVIYCHKCNDYHRNWGSHLTWLQLRNSKNAMQKHVVGCKGKFTGENNTLQGGIIFSNQWQPPKSSGKEKNQPAPASMNGNSPGEVEGPGDNPANADPSFQYLDETVDLDEDLHVDLDGNIVYDRGRDIAGGGGMN